MTTMRQSAALVVLLASLGLVGGCDNKPQAESGDTGCATLAATVEVGTGNDAFVSLAEGADLPFYHGPQGGYHVYGSLTSAGFDPGDPLYPFDPANPRITFLLGSGDVVLASFEDQPRALVPAGDGAELFGQVVVIGVDDPPSLDGTEATLAVTVVDRCGREATDTRGVVLRLQPDA
ncbi:MAG: hypothetical protein ABMA64_28430 [Myxococcota bacterium]